MVYSSQRKMAVGIVLTKNNIFVPDALVREDLRCNIETQPTTLNVLCVEKVSQAQITMGRKEELSAQE